MTRNHYHKTSLHTPSIRKEFIHRRSHRPLSIAARVWIAADLLYPPAWTTIIIEGKGIIDPQRWKDAIRIASDANPGSRLVLRGRLSWSHWVDSGKAPSFLEFNGGSWDGMSSEGLNPFLRTYDIRKGPASEVLILHGNPIRVIFRAHHAIMDGRGLITWAEDIFRVLNGLHPLGSNHLIIENDLLNLPDKNIHHPPAYNFISPTGKPSGSDSERIWCRVSVQGHYSKLLARIMILIARAARRNEEGPVRFGIPVDLRSRSPGLRSTGNLTNAIYISIEPESTVDQIAHKIQRRLQEQDDGKLNLIDKLIPYVPTQMLRLIMAKDEQQKFRANKYRCSGFITNLGRVELERFSGGGFTPTAFFVLPVAIASLPFFLAMSGYNDVIEYVLGMPRSYADQGRLGEILNYIVTGLDNVE